MQKLLGATFSGVFWLIDNPCSKFVGLLDIDEKGSAILKVEGDGPELMALDNRQKFHMHGNAEGQEITLFDCFATWVPPIPAQRKATIAANIVTIGALVDSLDQKLASALSFTTPEIIYWTRLRALAIKSGKKGIGATYRSKKTREVQVAGATFQFGTSIRYTTRSVSELDYLEQHSVRIVFSEPQSVASADRWVTRTCRLMELALRCPIKCSRVYA